MKGEQMSFGFEEELAGLTEDSWDKLHESMEEYNQYVKNHLKKMFDFDIWYEQCKGQTFPKEWYKVIRER